MANWPVLTLPTLICAVLLLCFSSGEDVVFDGLAAGGGTLKFFDGQTRHVHTDQFAIMPMNLYDQGRQISDLFKNTHVVSNTDKTEADLQHLSHALKVLSETEKQLRTSKNQTTWLTVALLQLNSGSSTIDANETALCRSTVHTRGSEFCSSSYSGESLKNHVTCACGKFDFCKMGIQEGKGTLESVWRRATEICESKSVRNFLQKKGQLAYVCFNQDERNVAGVDGQRTCALDVKGDSCAPGNDVKKCSTDCVKLVDPASLTDAFCPQDTEICRCGTLKVVDGQARQLHSDTDESTIISASVAAMNLYCQSRERHTCDDFKNTEAVSNTSDSSGTLKFVDGQTPEQIYSDTDESTIIYASVAMNLYCQSQRRHNCDFKSTDAISNTHPTPHQLRSTNFHISQSNFKTYFYDQILDHYNYNPESYNTFKQRYCIDFTQWGGPSAPIFAFLGAEEPLDFQLGVGVMKENAPDFRALQVYIEHRYYGMSNPLGSMEESLKNATIRGYFNSAQALEDFAEILLYLKQKYLSHHSPVIVVGASYGGMLASWFRLKYPHIAIGALASSAPILYFDGIVPHDAYFAVVSKDYKEASGSCYGTIQESWSEIDNIASKPQGLSFLSKKFNTCTNLRNSKELKDYLVAIYTDAAQYDAPPAYPVNVICAGINGAPNGTDILGRIVAGVASYRPIIGCTVIGFSVDDSSEGWEWQTCSEMVMPMERGNNTMFQAVPFNYSEFSDECRRKFGVQPRPHWITTSYGGQDIESVLRNFASNIIFSNGLRDPYSSGGVVKSISDSIVAVTTVNGSHCLDVGSTKASDPQWLLDQRKTEMLIIKGWLKDYYHSLNAAINKAGSGGRLYIFLISICFLVLF